MKRLRISASQVIHFSKVIEVDEEEFQELFDIWRDGSDKEIGDMVEDYIDIRNDIVDWDNIEDVDIIDDQTGRLLDV